MAFLVLYHYGLNALISAHSYSKEGGKKLEIPADIRKENMRCQEIVFIFLCFNFVDCNLKINFPVGFVIRNHSIQIFKRIPQTLRLNDGPSKSWIHPTIKFSFFRCYRDEKKNQSNSLLFIDWNDSCAICFARVYEME